MSSEKEYILNSKKLKSIQVINNKGYNNLMLKYVLALAKKSGNEELRSYWSIIYIYLNKYFGDNKK